MFWLRNKKNDFLLRTLIWGHVYIVLQLHLKNEVITLYKNSLILILLQMAETHILLILSVTVVRHRQGMAVERAHLENDSNQNKKQYTKSQ